jgi:hypothetical protein
MVRSTEYPPLQETFQSKETRQQSLTSDQVLLAKHSMKGFLDYSPSQTSTAAKQGNYYYWSHFTDGETEVKQD